MGVLRPGGRAAVFVRFLDKNTSAKTGSNGRLNDKGVASYDSLAFNIISKKG